MARQKGIIKLEGTIAGLTFVNSKKYGQHARSARGTHKEAKVNTVLQGNAENAKRVTSLASPVLRELKALEKGFASGDLWSKMMHRMLRVKDGSTRELFQSIAGIELNERYSFAKSFSSLPIVRYSVKKKSLVIELEFSSHAQFSKATKANAYLCEVAVLFLGKNGNCITHKMETDWISNRESLGVYEMEFEKPKGFSYFLVVAGVKGGIDTTAIESFAAGGYRIYEWGNC